MVAQPCTRLGLVMLLVGLVASLLVVGLALAEEPAPQAANSGDWLHYGYDSAYTGYNPVERTIAPTNTAKLLRRWGVDCDSPYGSYSSVSQSPAVYDGRLFTTASNTTTLNLLTAYDARTGARLWQFGKPESYAPQPVVSQDGIVFYMEDSYPTYLYAVNAHSGQQIWKFFTGLEVGYTEEAQVTVDEAKGRVYFIEKPFSAWGGKLWAAKKANGSVAWMLDKAHGSYDFKGTHVLLQSGKIYATARMTDTVMPHSERDRMVRVDTTAAAVDEIYDRVYPGDYGDYSEITHYGLCNGMLIASYVRSYPTRVVLAAYDSVATDAAWSAAPPPPPDPPLASTVIWTRTLPSELTGDFACNPAKNRLYVPTDPKLYALTATTGAEVWTYTGLGAIRTPSIANGILYFMSLTNLVAINEDTRQQVLLYPLGQTAGDTNRVAVAHGMLFFTVGKPGGAVCGLFALGFPPPVYLPVVRRD